MIAMYSKEYIAIAFNIDIFLKNRKLITMRCWTRIRTEISSAIADSISVLICRPTTLHCIQSILVYRADIYDFRFLALSIMYCIYVRLNLYKNSNSI